MKRDAGSATVVSVALLAVGVLVALAVAGAAGLAADRANARAAADLAALAGAYALRSGLDGSGTDPCVAAARAALANAARVTACRAFDDGSVQVRVASGGSHADARAGPQTEGPDGGSG